MKSTNQSMEQNMDTLVRALSKIPEIRDTLSLLVKRAPCHALFTGLSPVHRAHLAALTAQETNRPLIIVCPDESAMDTLRRDIESFLKVPVRACLSAREVTFYTAEGMSRQAEQERTAALFSMISGDSGVYMCTVSGLLQRCMPSEKLRASALKIELGANISPETVERALLNCGYERTEMVEGPGQFARRGGILDFFSPGSSDPVRCEFWGDEVDSMGFFDRQSQRRTEVIDSFTLLPASETLILPEERVKLIGDIETRLKRKSSKEGAERLKQTMQEDKERLSEGLSINADRYAPIIDEGLPTALDFIPENAVIFIDQPGKCAERAASYKKQFSADLKAAISEGLVPAFDFQDFALPMSALAEDFHAKQIIMADSFTAGQYFIDPTSACPMRAKQLPSYGGSLDAAAGDIKSLIKQGYRVLVLAADRRRAEALLSFLIHRNIMATMTADLRELPGEGKCVVSVGSLSAGLEYQDLSLAVLTDAQLTTVDTKTRSRKKAAVSKANKIGSCEDLSVGDLVVHEYHGIGRFAGIFRMPVDGAEKDYIKICYAGTDSLYVPATQLDLVSKYVGGGEEAHVKLSKMGGSDWTRVKTRAKAAAKQLAQGLIKLYAERARVRGHAFAPDSPWQLEFEESFGYAETEDQLRCIREIKTDMEKPVPMDRLLCGDVGYGKTEVALRAVMKCVLDGAQAAILVPTTVLAKQHYQTVLQRFFGYPIKAALLSRYQTPTQVKQIMLELSTGEIDIVIGTHKLLGKNIKFKNLGLLIVDEEQRFGVSHKEHIKEISKNVDVLTLSATPIPRTLNMALSGIRDMSTLDEPPGGRVPVQTFVLEHDWTVICDAIRREIQRGGQVYYLHNRVENIERTALRLRDMLDDGTEIAVAHGQMDEDRLSDVMEKMVTGQVQVLVCTTIIETGIDIPNVNTLIIEDADRLGLAQLHQIRGRVGRSSRRASAYLTFRRDKVLTETAEKRLSAIREFAEFNSGIKIAMRDLEIRGAGSLLGAEQSGHMMDVGYDMYMKLLEEAVREEKGEKPEVRTECAADLTVSANIPESYVKAPNQRMDLYRRIALIRTEEDADDITDELIDRFGDPPAAVNSLIHVALLRGEASGAGITDISQKGGSLYFTLADFDMERISALYALPEFKGKVKVEAGTKPRLSFKLPQKARVIDNARAFVKAWSGTKAQ